MAEERQFQEERVYSGLEFKRRQPVEAGTAQGQEWEADWSHSTTDRMQREMDVGAQCVFSFSISPGH